MGGKAIDVKENSWGKWDRGVRVSLFSEREPKKYSGFDLEHTEAGMIWYHLLDDRIIRGIKK